MNTLPHSIAEKLTRWIPGKILQTSFVGGGDISRALRLDVEAGSYFLKYHQRPQAFSMFATEAKGLALLAAPRAIAVPNVIGYDQTDDGWSFLLLEFIEEAPRPESFWEDFGRALAGLHRHSAPTFGLDFDNYIGSLPQSNRPTENWIDFYREERLEPQLRNAIGQGLLSAADQQSAQRLMLALEDLLPQEAPALIHGDFWSGNFLVGKEKVFLVDPAVCYAQREMDLAMSLLFGGFGWPFYCAYQEAFPTENGLEERIRYYQLYYLLVHVNLFGGGYVGAVRNILRPFS